MPYDNNMSLIASVVTIAGLALFEIVSSIDNAIINAEVLGTMGEKSRKWFLLWGLLAAVFLVRGLLPLLIVWFATPNITIIDAFAATFSGNTTIANAVETSAPILLAGGGTFLIFLFFHWLFLEKKEFGLPHERFFHRNGLWFYAVVSVLLAGIVWFALQQNPLMAFGAVIGSTAFFITHGFKQNAEETEVGLLHSTRSDFSKILYLEVIDTTFSIDGVLGAFAFTLSVPLILIGNGIGALVVRQLTMGNINRIKKYVFLKNGAMYSIICLGCIMLADAFRIHTPSYLSPLATFGIIGYFLFKSRKFEKN